MIPTQSSSMASLSSTMASSSSKIATSSTSSSSSTNVTNQLLLLLSNMANMIDYQVRQHELHSMEAPNLNGLGNLFTLWITRRTSIESWEVLERSFWCYYNNSKSKLLTLEVKGESFAYIHEFHFVTFHFGFYNSLFICYGDLESLGEQVFILF